MEPARSLEAVQVDKSFLKLHDGVQRQVTMAPAIRLAANDWRTIAFPTAATTAG